MKLTLSDGDLAFYDALETNDSGARCSATKRSVRFSREVVSTVRKNVTIVLSQGWRLGAS